MNVASPPRALPRGIRNNNPGNIRLSPTRWQGQRRFQFDPAFVEFDQPLMGLRALMRLLLTYHFKYGLSCVTSLVNRYAPPVENATDAYIHQVARRLKVGRNDTIDLRNRDILMLLARAIVRHENGAPVAGYPPDWYAPDLYVLACDKALQNLHVKENV